MQLTEVRPRAKYNSYSAGIPGVYVLPRIFTDSQLEVLCSLNCVATHDDDNGHHIRHDKTLLLPSEANRILFEVARLDLDIKLHSVDSMMKIYRLKKGFGKVHPHQDKDFDGPDGSKALYSILIRLNDLYAGGSTLFQGQPVGRYIEVGGGLLFKHDVMHEGLPVTHGEKFVLKTDLFVH